MMRGTKTNLVMGNGNSPRVHKMQAKLSKGEVNAMEDEASTEL